MFLQRLYLFAVNSHILKLAAFNSFLFAHEARFAKEITVNTSKSDKLMFNETSHTHNTTRGLIYSHNFQSLNRHFYNCLRQESPYQVSNLNSFLWRRK